MVSVLSEFLAGRPERRETLLRLVELRTWDPRFLDVPGEVVDVLMGAGVVKKVRRGDQWRFYVVNRAAVSAACGVRRPQHGVPVHVQEDLPGGHVADHEDLSHEEMVVAPNFEDVVGYGDIKQLISESVELGARVHYLLLGPPGSAKTLFLLGVERLSGSTYVLGSRMSRSGLSGFLMDSRPRFLLVDEVDKLPPRDLAPLLSLCESGRVIEVLNRKRREVFMGTIVFAAANSIKRLPPELLSRFQVLEFPEYTRDEFVEVCRRVLVRREGLSLLEAGQVAVRVLDELKSKDVRLAVRLARLARTSLGIDGVVEVFRKYQVG